jgi:hypothetical protein
MTFKDTNGKVPRRGCLKCDGTGTTFKSGVISGKYIKCGRCKGTGVVKAYDPNEIYYVENDPDSPQFPKFPPGRVLHEGSFGECHECHSSTRRFSKHCIQPECSNYAPPRWIFR